MFKESITGGRTNRREYGGQSVSFRSRLWSLKLTVKSSDHYPSMIFVERWQVEGRPSLRVVFFFWTVRNVAGEGHFCCSASKNLENSRRFMKLLRVPTLAENYVVYDKLPRSCLCSVPTFFLQISPFRQLRSMEVSSILVAMTSLSFLAFRSQKPAAQMSRVPQRCVTHHFYNVFLHLSSML